MSYCPNSRSPQHFLCLQGRFPVFEPDPERSLRTFPYFHELKVFDADAVTCHRSRHAMQTPGLVLQEHLKS